MTEFKKTVRYALQEGETVIEVDSLEFDNEKELNRFLENLYMYRMRLSFMSVGERFNKLSDGFRANRKDLLMRMTPKRSAIKASEKNRYSLRVDIE